MEPPKCATSVSTDTAAALRARLDAARIRVAALKLRLRTRPETIVVDETTGLPYNDSTYRHVVAEVRARAAQSVRDLLAEAEILEEAAGGRLGHAGHDPGVLTISPHDVAMAEVATVVVERPAPAASV